MKTVLECLDDLKAAHEARSLTEADAVKMIQADAYAAGYAAAARELLGIALESRERTDGFLNRAAEAGVIDPATARLQ